MALVPMDRRRGLPVVPMAETLETASNRSPRAELTCTRPGLVGGSPSLVDLPTSEVSGRTARQLTLRGDAGRTLVRRKRFGAARQPANPPTRYPVQVVRARFAQCASPIPDSPFPVQ